MLVQDQIIIHVNWCQSRFQAWHQTGVRKCPGCTGCAMAHPNFGRSVNPISTRGDRLCPLNYNWHTWIFRPSDGPDDESILLAVIRQLSGTYLSGSKMSNSQKSLMFSAAYKFERVEFWILNICCFLHACRHSGKNNYLKVKPINTYHFFTIF